MEIENKKISIIGAVRSGLGAAKLVKKKGGIAFVSDSADKEKIEKNLKILDEEKIMYEYGKHTEKVYDCDLMVVSPGVPSDSEVIQEAYKRNIKLISELELASRFCEGNIISITGTNGKTTTTYLCTHILNECGVKTYTAGNVGIAFSEVSLSVGKNEFVSLETSSFQLDHIDEFKPKYSIILNITPDHLDRYANKLENYISSKMKICKNQDEKDFFIANKDDKNTPSEIMNTKVKKLSFSLNDEIHNGCFYKNKKFYYGNGTGTEEICSVSDFSLKGEHNIANALAVLTVAKSMELPNHKIKKALGSFPGVEHRLEFVAEINGVKFINDSKATNVDSVWYALRSFEEPIYLILGGKDKGNDYNQIKELVQNNVKKIYAIGSSATKVYDFFNEIVEVEKMDTLENCVIKGSKEGGRGSIVLLSPACASFDMFDNYEHRGNVFKEAVNRLRK